MKNALKNPAVLFALYTALLGGNYVVYHMVLPVRISYHMLLTGLLIWWIWRDGLPSTPLLLPLLGMGAVSGISAFNSIDPRIALESWWHWLVNGLLMLMLITWIRRGWGETLFKTHFAIGGVVVAASLLQWVLSPGTRVGGAFMLINLTGAYAAALLVPAFVWAWTEKRLWLFAIGFGLVVVLLLNESRGAFISTGVATITFLLLRYRVKLPTLLFSAVIVIVLARGVMGLNALSGRIAGDVLRQDLWRSALAMVQDNPLTGVGPGLFGQAYRGYRTGSDDNMTGAHSIYLNILAELGVPGGVASALTGLIFLRSIPRKRSPKDDAVVAALAGIATHLLFDNFPATNFVFLVSLYVAYLSGYQKETRSKSAALKAAAARAITGVLLIFAFSFALMDAAQFYYEQSLSNHSVSEAMAAASLDPNNRLYQIHLARLQGDTSRVLELDPTFYSATDLGAYAVINFGRFLW